MPDQPTTLKPTEFLKLLRSHDQGAVADQAEGILKSAETHPRTISEQADRLSAVLGRDVRIHDEPYGVTWANPKGTRMLVTLPVPLSEEPSDESPDDEPLDDDLPLGPVNEATPEPAQETPPEDPEASAQNPPDPVDDAPREEPEANAASAPEATPETTEAIAAADTPDDAPTATAAQDSSSFFRSTARLTQHGPVTIVLAREGGADDDPELRVTLIPTASDKDHEPYTQPFHVSARASELDEGFLNCVDAAVEGNRGISEALEELKAAKEAEKTAQKTAADAAKKKATKTTKNTAKPKDDAKPKEDTKPASTPEPNLFNNAN